MDHKDSNFSFSKNELDMVCDKSYFTQKAEVLFKIKGHFSKLEEALYMLDFPLIPTQAKKRGKISQGENYLGAPWVVLDAPAYFSGSEIFAFRHIFLWGLNLSTTFHVAGRFLDTVDFDGLFNMNNPEIMILTGDDPFIHHNDPLVYKAISQLSKDEVKASKHLRISIFFKPNEWDSSQDAAIQFVKQIQTILKRG